MFYTDPRVGVIIFSQSKVCSASQQEQDVRDRKTYLQKDSITKEDRKEDG